MGGVFLHISTHLCNCLTTELHVPYHTVSEVFVVTTSVARAAELPVVRRPVSLITCLVLEL